MIGGTGRIEEKMYGATTPTHSAAFSTGGNYQNSTLSQSLLHASGSPIRSRLRLGGHWTALRSATANPNPDGRKQWDTPEPRPSLRRTRLPSIRTWSLFQHYQFFFTANSQTTTLTFQDLGTGNDNADSMVDTVSVLLAPPPSFARWQAAHFSQSQLNDPGVSGWAADPDLDGIANGLEYFFNTNPLTGLSASEAAALPRVAIITDGPSQYLTFTYRRLMAWDGPPEVVEVSDDLDSWDDTESQIEQVGSPTPNGDGFTETRTVRLRPRLTRDLSRTSSSGSD